MARIGFRLPLALCTLLPLLLHSAFAHPQPPPAYGTGLVVGQVIDAQNGRGVAGAIVTLGPRGAGERVMATSEGYFVFRDLAPGRYTITARRPGYLEGAYGRRRPGGGSQTLVLGDGERLGGITIPVWKHAAISGMVIDEAGEPVVGIQVLAMRRTVAAGRRGFAGGASARTDDRGIYRIASLAPGDYAVAVVSTQVLVPISVAEQYREELQEGNAPTTSRYRALFDAGATPSFPGSPTTAEVGSFLRTLGRGPVPPPVGADDRVFVYPTIYFPAATSSQRASLVTVGPGEERESVDIQVKPVPTARVSGIVTRPDDQSGSVALRLVVSEGDDYATGLDAATTVSAPDGTFTFLGVPAGDYVLHVLAVPRPAPGGNMVMTMTRSGSGIIFGTTSPGQAVPAVPTEPTLWARVPITVGTRDITDLNIALQVGPRVSGRIVFDGTAARPTPQEISRVPIAIEPADGSSSMPRIPPGRADPGGRFTSFGLPAGRYLVRPPSGPPGWTFHSAMFEGRDISDTPLELEGSDAAGVVLTFTDRPSRLSGSVRTAQGGPDPDATVLVFPAERTAWIADGVNPRRLRSQRGSSNGSFTIEALPSGDYFAVAVPEERTSDWAEPDNLEALARRAERVRITDGQTASVNLVVR
ncbi:MAG TPA: carboxypeptidase-like regulatory domain-containing protein [Vicinamibacterales bacterium]|nr:carboxypeptidase-like regulatory domain-containing protein [Vicinamibacterales bacterium]